MVLNELTQGTPALYRSSRSSIAAKGSSNLKASFNFCCSSKSARSSMVGLTSDSSVLTSKLHTKLLRNLGPAQPDLGARKNYCPEYFVFSFLKPLLVVLRVIITWSTMKQSS